MDYRTTKQALYGSIYLAILIFIGTWFYFLVVKPAPSCFDSKKNQNEEGVDCGGVCAQICLPANLQPISLVNKVQTFFPVPNKATLLARIQNPNTTHGGPVSYSFVLYDDKNQIIITIPQSTVIYPSEVKYVIVPSVDLEDASARVKRADLQIQEVDWQTAELLSQPKVVVRDQAVSVEGGFISVRGSLTNNDIVEVTPVRVIAIFFNQFQVPIGAARTELSDLQSGETRMFTINHPILPSLVATKTQVFLATD